ncbi:unnamed protein product [Acanthoscelides obtectus]|uniref:Uncharacterized protein n=1 Tax=Acanthoscelides obtectus TaxID=200917 RepID=A0A9P0KXL0_ACAOB|nr:unnamed protein product [Acanthoscelides obtectus]CAK1659381.1 Pickpocket protein 28 [Acanthoscelides obtectus]
MDDDAKECQYEDPTFFKSVRNYFREYCQCTSIHGFRYFGEKRSYIERAWWFIVFSLVLAGCVIAIREVYEKWIRSPVIVSFATKETPIYSIPFPAVTICPESKTSQALYNHTAMFRKKLMMEELTKEEQRISDYMGLICTNDGYEDSDVYYFSDDFYNTIDEFKCTFPFFYCAYMRKVVDCSELFIPVITDEGICYTFNMLDRTEIYRDRVVQHSDFLSMGNTSANEWNLDDGYGPDIGLDAYPRRALLAGADNSLTIFLLSNRSDLDYTCKGALQGFRVTLHTPMRIPRPSQQYFRVPLNQEVLAAIRPDMILTSTSVKMYNPKKRECYFPQEKTLKYFKIYTSMNCKLECLTNYTLYYCGCVNYFMPRDNDTYLCGIGAAECMKEAAETLQIRDLHREIDKPRVNKTKGGDFEDGYFPDCDCMPICTDLTYHAEITQSDWPWQEFIKARTVNDTMAEDEVNLSRLTLYFKSSRFITSQRHELYGPTDFLANFGGLLGLFTGFSILSLMEAIYFLTVRICCNTRLYGYWAGPAK